MDELIARLRAVSETGCDPDLPHEAADAIVALRAERDALVARLEVDPEYSRPDGIDCRDATIALQDARIADLEAQLKELEGQEPVAWVDVKDSYEGPYSFEGMKLLAIGKHHLFARPLPADPVNARLLDIATGKLSHLYAGLCPDSASGTRSRDPECPACRAIAAAEAQQAEPVRLTDEDRQQIWNVASGHVPGWARHLKYAADIEAAVLRANGYKVEG